MSRNVPERRSLHAQAATDAVLSVRLTEPQVETLQRWLQAQQAAGPPGGIVERHSIALPKGLWEVQLKGWCAPLVDAASLTINRAQVLSIARACRASGEWVPLLVASFIWGQGKNGYGPYRLAKILGDGDSRSRTVQAALQSAAHRLATDGSESAYQALRGNIAWFGPAFFTKFMYFAGLAESPATGPAPLILDRVLARLMRGLAAIANEAVDVPDPVGMARWQWPDGGWTAHRYGVYLQVMNGLTAQLVEADVGWPNRADLLELALFRTNLNGGT